MAAHPRMMRVLVLPAVILAVAGLLLGGCTAPRLNQAQIYAYASPYNLYLQADGILSKDTAAKTSDLKSDKLLGTAYACTR